MTREEMAAHLAGLLPREPQPYESPEQSDWEFVRQKFRTEFPEEFVHFIDLMSTFSFPGEILNVRRSGRTNGNDSIAEIYDAEMSAGRWSEHLVPFFRIGNGDYFCINSKEGIVTAVYYYYHEDARIERFSPSFAAWVEQLAHFLNA